MKIPVTFRIHTDARGIEFILPDADALAKMIASTQAQIDRQEGRLAAAEKAASEAEPAMLASRVAYRTVEESMLDRLTTDMRRLVNLRDVYLPASETRIYEFTLPTYGKVLAAKDAPGVKTLNPSGGMVSFDDGKLAALLLKEALPDVDVAAMPGEDLPLRLWGELKAMLYPDPAALSF